MHKKFKRIYIIFITIPIVCIIFFLIYRYSVRNKIINENVSDNTGTILTVTPYLERANDWRIYNYGSSDKLISYSFEIPYPGNYCNGCFDGISGCFNNDGKSSCAISTISGGYFSTAGHQWLIAQGIFNEFGTRLSDSQWGIPSGNFIDELFSIQINETLNYFDKEKGTITYNLESIKYIENVPIRIFSSSSSSDFDLENPKIMLFKKNGKIIFISFKHENDDQFHSNVFQHILDTFQFSLRKNNDYGTTIEEFNKPIPTEDPRLNNITLHPPENWPPTQ
jgi:hypothetical protein